MYRVTPSRVISLSATNSPSQSFPISNPLNNIVDKRCHQEAEEVVQEVVQEGVMEEVVMEEVVVGGPAHPHHTEQRIPLIIHQSIY